MYFFYRDTTQGSPSAVSMRKPKNAVGMIHTHTSTPGDKSLNRSNERLSSDDAKIINGMLGNNRPVLNGKVYDGPVFGGLATPSGKIRFFYANDDHDKSGGPNAGPLNQHSNGIAVPAPTCDFEM